MSAPGAINPPPGTRLQQGKDVHETVDAGHPSLAAARGGTNADTSQKPGAAAAGGGEMAGNHLMPAHISLQIDYRVPLPHGLEVQFHYSECQKLVRRRGGR